MKERIDKYEAVNNAETLKELADVIRSFATRGKIKGRNDTFDCERMAIRCENYSTDIHNSLTRQFGIRQQAMMILFYTKLSSTFQNTPAAKRLLYRGLAGDNPEVNSPS